MNDENDSQCCWGGLTGRAGWESVHRVHVSDDLVRRRAAVDHQPSGHRLQLQETVSEIFPLGLHEDRRQRCGERSRRPAARRVRSVHAESQRKVAHLIFCTVFQKITTSLLFICCCNIFGFRWPIVTVFAVTVGSGILKIKVVCFFLNTVYNLKNNLNRHSLCRDTL